MARRATKPPRAAFGRDARINFCLSPAEKAAMKVAAARRGLNLSVWLRMLAMDAVRRDGQVALSLCLDTTERHAK